MGYAYFSLSNRPSISLLYTLTFLFASIAVVYFIWISPDFFNLFLVFAVAFLWLYKIKYSEKENQVKIKSRLQSFLLSDWTDYSASALVGIAVFSKPPNIVLMGPLVLYVLFKKRFLKALLMILVFLLVSSLFWGTNYLTTGEWNYQGGERKTFYGPYPLEKEGITFDSLGHEMTSEGYGGKHLLPPRVFIYNLFYCDFIFISCIYSAFRFSVPAVDIDRAVSSYRISFCITPFYSALKDITLKFIP